MPTFLTGDFNSPSHLDWTAAVSAVRPEVPYPVDWPVSQRARRCRLPRLVPRGPSGSRSPCRASPGRRADPRATRARSTTASTGCSRAGPRPRSTATVVGEAGGPDVGIGFDPWPTDHRGVLSTFLVTPAVPAPFVAPAERRVFVGDEPRRPVSGGSGTGQSVAIVPAGAAPAAAVASVPGRAAGRAGRDRDLRHDRARARRLRRDPRLGRRRPLAHPVLAVRARDADDGLDVEADLPRRRADRGQLGAAPGLPLGLARACTRRATRRRARTAPAATPAARAMAGYLLYVYTRDRDRGLGDVRRIASVPGARRGR